MTEEVDAVTNEPNTIGRKKDGTFTKGSVPNPNGRPVGTRNKHLIAVENLLDGEAEKLSRKAVDLALAGDTTCLRICLERILPPRKDRPLSMDLPKVTNIDEIATAMGSVVEHVGSGAITPSEGQALAGLLQGFSQSLEMSDLAKRLDQIESKIEGNGK